MHFHYGEHLNLNEGLNWPTVTEGSLNTFITELVSNNCIKVCEYANINQIIEIYKHLNCNIYLYGSFGGHLQQFVTHAPVYGCCVSISVACATSHVPFLRVFHCWACEGESRRRRQTGLWKSHKKECNKTWKSVYSLWMGVLAENKESGHPCNDASTTSSVRLQLIQKLLRLACKCEYSCCCWACKQSHCLLV